MKRVARSSTRVAFCKEMITEISGIKALKDNAFNSIETLIETAILQQKYIATGLEKEYQRLHNDLKVCIKYILLIVSERFIQVYLLSKITQLDYLDYQLLKIF